MQCCRKSTEHSILFPSTALSLDTIWSTRCVWMFTDEKVEDAMEIFYQPILCNASCLFQSFIWHVWAHFWFNTLNPNSYNDKSTDNFVSFCFHGILMVFFKWFYMYIHVSLNHWIHILSTCTLMFTRICISKFCKFRRIVSSLKNSFQNVEAWFGSNILEWNLNSNP